MSKAVKGIGRAMGGIMLGATKLVKKAAKTKLGKIALTAAAIYFAVPAVSGMLGGGATGTVMGNLSSAWSGLTGAASSAMAGNFSAAGSSLASGFTGAGAAGATTAAMGPPLSAASPLVEAGASLAKSGAALKTGLAPVAAGTGGLLSSPYAAPALIQAGAGMLQGYAQGKQQQDLYRRQKEEKEEDRRRYSTNVGTRLWGG